MIDASLIRCCAQKARPVKFCSGASRVLLSTDAEEVLDTD